MSTFEVAEPILNSPYDEPQEYWYIQEGAPPERRKGRRPATYYFRDPKARPDNFGRQPGTAIELVLVNRIRNQLNAWRDKGYPGVTRTTLELLEYWQREGRRQRLFFAQLEAAMTVIFLTEARADFRQGIQIPRDEPSDTQKEQGFVGFPGLSEACRLAAENSPDTHRRTAHEFPVSRKKTATRKKSVKAPVTRIKRQSNTPQNRTRIVLAIRFVNRKS